MALWAFVSGKTHILAYSETKPDGVKLSGFFIFKTKKGTFYV